MALNRAERIHDYLMDRSDRKGEDCITCLDKKARCTETRYVYETPWDDQEAEKPFCSEECAEIYLYEGDFSYFWCEPCQRDIWRYSTFCRRRVCQYSADQN